MAATGEPYRSQKTLDLVFAGSCAAMLLTTIWMFAQDYYRDYKGVQRTFRDVEATLAEREMIDKLPDPELVNEKRAKVRKAKENLQAAKKSVATEERKLTAQREKADEEFRGIKAQLDAEMSYYNIAIDDAGKYPNDSSQGKALLKESKSIRKKKLDPLEADLASAKKKLDEIDAQIKDKVGKVVNGPENDVTTAEDELKKLTGVFDRFAKLSAQKAWSTGDTLRTLPIMDGFESPTKIRQLWLPQLTIDMGGFKDAARYDRCTTCHLGIDRATFEREALTRIGDDDDNRRLVNKLESAHTMLEKRQNSGEKLGFDPNDLPGESSGSMGWIVFSMLGCVLVGAVSLGLLTQSGRVGVYLLTGGLVMTLVTSGALAFFAPHRPAIKTIKLTDSQVTQYASHPKLDLFVDANSPHPAEKFGCTICHAGQGSATDFNLATHTPNDATQTHRWQKDYHYHATHDWDFPMLSKRFIESSCVKCHHQVTDLIRHGVKEEAPKLLRGYNLVKDMGCFGCHEIQGTMSGRSIGPDIRLESAPALDQLTAADQEKATSDPTNPPGNMRKVGPSLRRLAEKTGEEWTTHWVASPRGFRPDTKMPHFYNLTNNKKETLPDDQQNFPAVEIHAVSHYLIHESKAALEGKDVYREGLLDGKESLKKLQDDLITSGLTDKKMKDLFDVSKRFVELAILSAPLQNAAINADSARQRMLQERLGELQRRLSAGGTDAVIKQGKRDIEATGKELLTLTADLIRVAKPISIASRILGEDGEAVSLPAGEGNKANGQRLFAEKGCMACHQHEGTLKKTTGSDNKPIPAVRGVSNFGPDLSRVADKLMPVADRMTARAWLVQWILNPNVYHPRTKMPITHLKVSDANDVATWLLSQKTGWKGEPTDPAAPTLADLKKLARVYLEKAPAMTKADAEAFLPEEGTAMPGIPKERLNSMVREADERRLEAGKVTEGDLKWYVGKKAIARLGCFGCHDIPGFETAKPIGTGLNDWGKKVPDRLAFEDGDNFVKRHFNIVPTLTTRGEVEKRIKAIEAKGEKDRTPEDEKDLKRLNKQVTAQDRIHELEAKALKEGLSAKEAHELEKLKPLQFFEPSKDDQGNLKGPYEAEFYHSLEHHQREGFLHLKLAEPRSYDFNRIRAWDDRLRMPQFKFARTKRLADDESEADFLSRSDKAEAEAREAVMTFILGLVAEPIPTQYVHAPKPEKQAEIIGRQVLDKYNCASCHQVRPGVYEFKVTDPILTRLQATQKNDMEREAPIDHVFLNHSAWFGSGGSGDRLTAIGVYDDLATKTLQDGGDNVDAIRLTDALRFYGKDRVMRDLPAGNSIYLPVGSYKADGPFGGTWTESMISYLGKRDSQNYPKTDPGKARSALPPPLVREGERVQPDWLYKFLLNPKPIRPESYMLLRMPKFNMSPEESRALVNYFASVSRLTNPGAGVSVPYVTIEQRNEEYWKRMSRQYEVNVKTALTEAEVMVKKMESDIEKLKKDKDGPQKKKAIADQEKVLQPWSARAKLIKTYLAQPKPKKGNTTDLYSVQAYQLLTNKNLCLKCHPVGSLAIEAPQGPNLSLASERLRPEWMEEWIAHPKRMFTYPPVMPQNFPNDADPLKWQWQDSFVGTPIQQTRAVRDLLMDLPRLNDLIANVPPAPTPPPPPPPKGDKK